MQPAQLQMLATLGHPAHFMRDEPADGVKVLARRTALNGYPECFGDPIDGRVATHTVGLVGQTKNVARVFCNVEFVFDFAHDLFEHVLDGDQARHATKLVDHDGQVIAVASEFTQQIVQALALGHKHGRPDQRADVEIWGPLQLEQVLGHQDADDVFALPLKHRKARVASIDHRTQQCVGSLIDVDHVHARGCHHDIASGHVGHANHALDHHARISADHLVVFGFRQGFDEFFRRVGAGVNELGHFLQKGALVFFFRQTTGVWIGHCRGLQDLQLWWTGPKDSGLS